MLTAEIIAVGTELLMGQIVNTNAQFLAERLTGLGISVLHQTVVGDNPARLRAAAELALSRCDAVIFTGGLGPTDDDLTKETVAELFGAELKLHRPSVDKMRAYIKGAMPENNLKQAYLPAEGDGVIIPNNNGTAPGCIFEKDGKTAVLLPGPPGEMKPMFLDTVEPYLRDKSGAVLRSRVLRIFGIGESAAAERISGLIKSQTNPTIAPYAKEGEVTFRITAMAGTAEEAEELLKPTVGQIYREFGDLIYAEGDGATMAETVVKLLREKNKTLATAESCTGGMIGRAITDIPGASEVYGFGFITYANEAKEQILGVRRETLEAHGAVSPETAAEMAAGAKRVSGADIAVAVTGIAGPGGGTPEKPVGLVYVGLASERGVRTVKLNLSGDRRRVRLRTVLNALDAVRRELV